MQRLLVRLIQAILPTKKIYILFIVQLICATDIVYTILKITVSMTIIYTGECSYKGVFSMEELYNRLNSFPGAHFGFVMGVIAYVKQKPDRLKKVMEYLNSSDSLSKSDVILFISTQPDFFDTDSAEEQVI